MFRPIRTVVRNVVACKYVYNCMLCLFEKEITRKHTCNHCRLIILIKMLIFSVDSRLLFLCCSLMSVPLKGGNQTIINMGDYDDNTLYTIAVLHRECGSSGKKTS